MNGKTISDAIGKFIEWAIVNPFAFCVWVAVAIGSVGLLLNGAQMVGIHWVAPFADVQKLAWFMAACWFAKGAR